VLEGESQSNQGTSIQMREKKCKYGIDDEKVKASEETLASGRHRIRPTGRGHAVNLAVSSPDGSEIMVAGPTYVLGVASVQVKEKPEILAAPPLLLQDCAKQKPKWLSQ
jgi:hypothetical protein